MFKENNFPWIIGILIIIIYGASLFGGYVFDDRGILEHSFLLSSLNQLFEVFLYPYWTIEAGLYRPSTLLSYLFNNLIFGSQPWGFHLINLGLYFGICLLIFKLLKRLFKDYWLAFLTALFFLVFPIHTEVVANITGRSELLALIFSLLTLLEVLREKPRILLVFIFTFLSIGAKETGLATLPLVFLVLVFDLKSIREVFRTHWALLLASFSGILAYFLLRFLVLGPDYFLGVETSLIENPLMFAQTGERVATSLSVLAMYLGKTFWPVNLCSDYSFNQYPIISSFLNLKVLIGSLSIIISFSGFFYFFKRNSFLALAFAVFLLSFIPVSNILFPIGTIAGERLFFFPSLGLAMLLTYLLRGLRVRILALLIIIVFSVLSLIRQSAWINEERLFLSALECAPQSVLSLSNAGTVYYFRGDYVRAEELLERSRSIKPIYPKGLNNLGLVYWKQGRFDEAEALYHQALNQKFPYWGAVENLVLLNLSRGDEESTLRWLRIAYPNVDDSSLRSLF